MRATYSRALWVAILLLVPHPSAQAAEPSLKTEVKELRQIVEALQVQVTGLREERQRDKVEIARLRNDEMDRQLAITPGDVDRRIQAFDVFNTSKLFISGYGTTSYLTTHERDGTFGTSFNPIFHFQVTEDLHLIAEPELSFGEDGFESDLEILELDWFINDYLTLTGGRFLLPFNAFGPRLHPAYINKFPSPPPIYSPGHGGHGGTGPGIVPILRDVGFMVSGGAPLPFNEGSKFNYAFFVGNGPRMEAPHVEEAAVTEDEHHDEEGEEEHPEEGHEENGHEEAASMTLSAEAHGAESVGLEMMESIPEIEWNENFVDNNNNKVVGGRIGVLPFYNVEVGASYMGGKYDSAGRLGFTLWGLDGEFHKGPFELRGEYIQLDQETGHYGTITRRGAYGQVAYRLVDLDSLPEVMRRLELVTRVGRLFGDGPTTTQTAFGINYYIRPSVPIKIGYEINEGNALFEEERVLAQFAFGF